MSLPPDAAPPGHLPQAATPPWPIQPPPHGAAVSKIPVKPRPPEPAIGTLGIALIGGAAAAAIGLLIAIPLLRRKPAPPKRKPPQRRKKKSE